MRSTGWATDHCAAAGSAGRRGVVYWFILEDEMMTLNITLDLPETVLTELESSSLHQRRSVGDLIREVVIQNWQPLPQLPDDVESELAAFPHLSDEVLWLVARSTLTAEEQRALAFLNGAAKTRHLESAESARLETLLDLYDRLLVRRAQAAAILQQRGYDLRNPQVLQPQ